MGKTKKQNFEEIDIEKIKENIESSRKITEDIIEYNIYVNDLNIEEEDLGAMTSILEEYLEMSNKADEYINILESDNKKINMKRLEDRLNKSMQKVEEVSNLEEEYGKHYDDNI